MIDIFTWWRKGVVNTMKQNKIKLRDKIKIKIREFRDNIIHHIAECTFKHVLILAAY